VPDPEKENIEEAKEDISDSSKKPVG